MAEETIYIEVSDEELDAALAKADEALRAATDVRDAQTEVRREAPSIEAHGGRLEGIEYAQRRIIAMIPGVRDAYFLLRQVQTLLRLSPEVAALIAAALIIREAIAYFERQEQRMRDLEDLVKKYRGLGTRREARAWLDEQERLGRQAYQGANP